MWAVPASGGINRVGGWLLVCGAATGCLQGCGGAGGGAASQRSAEALSAQSTPSSVNRAIPELSQFRKPATRSVKEWLAEPRYANANLDQGALLSLACQACHVMKRGVPSTDAPNLYGLFGRRAGTRADFDYSSALSHSGIIWTPAALEAWLAGPAALVPGTKMKFAGFQRAASRRNVVAYLLHQLGAGQAASTAHVTAEKKGKLPGS